MNDILSYKNMKKISKELGKSSDTWSDFWEFLCYTHLHPSQVLKIKIEDINKKNIKIPTSGKFPEVIIPLNNETNRIVIRRKIRYPNDIYLFQSHSNRVKLFNRPITLIAFNRALRKASYSTCNILISSKHSFYFDK